MVDSNYVDASALPSQGVASSAVGGVPAGDRGRSSNVREARNATKCAVAFSGEAVCAVATREGQSRQASGIVGGIISCGA